MQIPIDSEWVDAVNANEVRDKASTERLHRTFLDLTKQETLVMSGVFPA